MSTQRREEKSAPRHACMHARALWLLFLFYFFLIFKLYIIVLVLPNIKMNPPQVYMWLLFLYVFLSPLGLPYVNWVSQECCLFYLRSSLLSSDLPLFYFCGLFSSLSFSHRHSGLFFHILTT